MPNKGAARHDDALYDSGQRARMLDGWRERAACQGRGDVMEDYATQDVARRICRHCPVLADCGEWVMSLPPSEAPDGITAGQTPAERGGHKAAATRQKEMSST